KAPIVLIGAFDVSRERSVLVAQPYRLGFRRFPGRTFLKPGHIGWAFVVSGTTAGPGADEVRTM
ncbi:hypothetical protein, partial [Herbidospora cretacea]|uniref:hypothetical protein n=1 Tax=Herbidospora cretacea TaxID=28444 RepID=UPI001E283950